MAGTGKTGSGGQQGEIPTASTPWRVKPRAYPARLDYIDIEVKTARGLLVNVFVRTAPLCHTIAARDGIP